MDDSPVDSQSSQKPPGSARQSRRRGMPDLAALFEEVDQKPKATKSGNGGLAKTDFAALADLVGASPPAMGAEPIAEQRGIAEGDREFQSSKSAAEAENQPEGQLAIPAELEAYLPPDLWRKLNSPSPSRGILINALERVRSLLYLVSTFLPRHLVQEKMRRPYPGAVRGQMLSGTLLFSDVSGFTALSERLAAFGQEGAERLTAEMNRYFSAMLDILAESDGILLKFAGDALLAYFPEQEAGKQASWAVRAGRRMLRRMADFAQVETPGGMVTLRMKLGVATGSFLAASVGSAERMEYVVLGQAVEETMAAEGLTTGGGQLVFNSATAHLMDNSLAKKRLKNNYYLLNELPLADGSDDFEIQAEARRARGAVPWNATSQAILAQIEVAVRQIRALVPYLAPELVERIIASQLRRKIESQFRPTTVMFCNFQGLESLLQMWGEEGAARTTNLLNAYFNAVQQAIACYGGIISRIDPYNKGMKLLALFGAPVAHEDDTQRAISAALAMNAELEALDDAWKRRLARHLPSGWSGPLLQHRIGITYGRTYAGLVGSSTRREYTVMGDDVNLAARLMSTAELGRVLINQAARDQAGDYFVLTSRPPVRVKGKSQPVQLFQVEGPQDDTLANRARQRGHLMGREDELARGIALLQSSLSGAGSTLIIQGPAGIGKSHLADELLKRAEASGAQITSILCHSYNAGTPYMAWSAFLREVAGITALDYELKAQSGKFSKLFEALGVPVLEVLPLVTLLGLPTAGFIPSGTEKLEVASTDLEHVHDSELLDLVKSGRIRRRGSQLDVLERLDRQVSDVAGKTYRSAGGKPQTLFRASKTLLEHLSVANCRVIFFEDAQWMDSDTLALLQELTPHLAQLPVLVMIARRSEAQEKAVEFGEVLNLKPLSQAGTEALVAHLLTADLARVIHDQSSGNPLFVSEITRWFKLTHNFGAEELQEVLQSSDFLQKLVLSNLEGLLEGQRLVIKAASVIGEEFRTGEVQVLLGEEMDAVTLSNHLRSLARAGLISLTEAGADACYAFQQSLAREVVYNSLPVEQRRVLHRQLAEYLSTPLSTRRRVQVRLAAALDVSQIDNPAQKAGLIAFHYEQAQSWFAAAQQRVIAGAACKQDGLYRQAAIHYQRALENLRQLLPETQSPETAGLYRGVSIDLGDIAVLEGNFLSAVPAYESAMACLLDQVETEEIKRLTVRLALVLPTQGRSADALALLRKLAPTAREAGDLNVAAQMAWLLWRQQKAEARKWIARCRELLHDVNDPWAFGIEALLEDLSGEWELAILEYLELNKSVGAALAAISLGDYLLESEKPEESLVRYQQAERQWEQMPVRENAVALAFFQQARAYWHMKDKVAACHALERALENLPKCPPSLRANLQSTVQKANKFLSTGSVRKWPVCDWQAYDDEFRISLLFRL